MTDLRERTREREAMCGSKRRLVLAINSPAPTPISGFPKFPVSQLSISLINPSLRKPFLSINQQYRKSLQGSVSVLRLNRNRFRELANSSRFVLPTLMHDTIRPPYLCYLALSTDHALQPSENMPEQTSVPADQGSRPGKIEMLLRVIYITKTNLMVRYKDFASSSPR